MSLPHRNQSIDLQSKSIDWFLCERDIDRYRVKDCTTKALWKAAFNKFCEVLAVNSRYHFNLFKSYLPQILLGVYFEYFVPNTLLESGNKRVNSSFSLTSQRNQSIDLQNLLMDCFLFDENVRFKGNCKSNFSILCSEISTTAIFFSCHEDS